MAQVTRITLIYGELLHFVEFEFNDGTYKSGGGNIEGAVRPPYVYFLINVLQVQTQETDRDVEHRRIYYRL